MKTRKNYTLLVVVILLVLLTAGAIGLKVNGRTVAKADLNTEIYQVSKGLYTGKGYELNYEQKKKLEDNQEKNRQKEEHRKEQEKDQSQKDPYKNISQETDINSQLSQALVDNSKKGNSIKGDSGTSIPGGNGGTKVPDNPGNQQKPDQGGTDTSKLPSITTDLVDGKTYANCFAPFYVQARDYKGNLLTGYLGKITVTVNGTVDSGASKKDNSGREIGRNYQVDLNDGKNIIVITAEDQYGNSITEKFTVYGDKNAAIPDADKATVYFSLNLSNLGINSSKYDRTMTMRSGEIVSRGVEKYLASLGITPESRGGTYGYYLSGLCGNNLFKGMRLTKEQIDNIEAGPGFTLDFNHGEGIDDNGYIILNGGYNCLREMDITKDAGWMFKYNGKVVGFGMSNEELHDGDLVEIFWTNRLGWDADGGWDPNAGV